MLMDSNRPHYLKRRILSRVGHLDNNEAIGAFDELITERTRKVMLGHISSDCNTHAKVEELAAAKLASLNRSDISLQLMKQKEPNCPVLVG